MVCCLHNSSITNDPAIVADSTIYTAFGGTVPPGQMGVRARLFKSGVLCIANNYTSNSGFANSLHAPTSGYCGPGSYNSHGYVRAWNGTGFSEYFTFPSNPVWSLDSAARSVSPDQVEPESGTNAQGQTYGSGLTAASDAELPDLVAAYGTGGEEGYVKSSAISASASTVEEVTAQSKAPAAEGTEVFVSGPDPTPLYAQDGTTVVGTFDLN